MMKMALYLVVFLAQTHNPSLIMRNTSDEFKLNDILQTSCPVPLNTVSRSSKPSNVRETLTAKRRLGK